MGVKTFRPLTPSQRYRIDLVREDISKVEPEKSLTKGLIRSAGRDNSGRVSIQHRGGGNKRAYRQIDFRRDKENIGGTIATIEYDPFRTALIAKVVYGDGEKRYILAPLGLKVGMIVRSSPEAEIQIGNHLPLRHIPVGSMVHNVELVKGRGGQMGRSAGAVIQLMAKEGDKAILKLPSGEQRIIHLDCRATIGQVGNLDKKNISLGKAGRKRHLGWRPTVRGSVKNPCDHPHGGGEGKAPVGRPGPVTPWGKPTLGYKTRHKRRNSDRFILRRRK